MVRDIQAAFTRSNLFSSSLAAEKADRARLSAFQKNRRKDKSVKVKVGHGGTLDPLATGVLIIGVGKGTKSLPKFLGCSKTYEVDLLFGAATDTYDILGRVLSKASYAHITRDRIEKELERFRGSIMQRPPIYSALRVQGKHLYEYAREGKEVPIEIQERPVTVHSLEVTNWLEDHDYEWPEDEADAGKKAIAERLLHFGETAICDEQVASDSTAQPIKGPPSIEVPKRKRSHGFLDEAIGIGQPPVRKAKRAVAALAAVNKGSSISTSAGYDNGANLPTSSPLPFDRPPVASIRMIVSSGFYVRSFCHDLGKAVGSLGIMARLVRITQGDFELGRNVLDYDKLNKGEEVWCPEVERMLRNWSQAEGVARDQG